MLTMLKLRMRAMLDQYMDHRTGWHRSWTAEFQDLLRVCYPATVLELVVQGKVPTCGA